MNKELIEELDNIRNLGWVKTHRAGNTGVGKTLEDLLGVDENNFCAPDIAGLELKASRKSSSSMMTLFTRSPRPRGSITVLKDKFGREKMGTKSLHTTLTATNKGKSPLFLDAHDNKISIRTRLGEEGTYWTFDDFFESVNKKYSRGLIHALAHSHGSGIDERFHYYGFLVCQGFNQEKFLNMLKRGEIFVDIRVGQYRSGKNKGKTHDHGTAFRVKRSNIKNLFDESFEF